MKAIVLLSGGVDSAVCAMRARKSCVWVGALSVRYGQPDDEIVAAVGLADELRLDEHIIANVGMDAVCTSALWSRGQKEDEPPAYVPARNAVLLSLAASYAEERGCGEIWFGATADDAKYPDCRPVFVRAMAEALGVTIRAPLISLRAREILMELGRLRDKTLSCYFPKAGKPCGSCAACLRLEVG